METICSCETSVDFQRTTRRYIPENSALHARITFGESEKTKEKIVVAYYKALSRDLRMGSKWITRNLSQSRLCLYRDSNTARLDLAYKLEALPLRSICLLHTNLWWLLPRNWNILVHYISRASLSAYDPTKCHRIYWDRRPTLSRRGRLIFCTTGPSLIKFDLIWSYKNKCQTAFNGDPYNKFNRNAFGSFWDETWETTDKTYLLRVNLTHFLLNTQRPWNL
jgi:hypothetical protein